MKRILFLLFAAAVVLALAAVFRTPSVSKSKPVAPSSPLVTSKFRDSLARHRQIVSASQAGTDEGKQKRDEMLAQWRAADAMNVTIEDILRRNANRMAMITPGFESMMGQWGLDRAQMDRVLAAFEDYNVEFSLIQNQDQRNAVGQTPEEKDSIRQQLDALGNAFTKTLQPILGDAQRLEQLQSVEKQVIAHLYERSKKASKTPAQVTMDLARQQLGHEPSREELLDLLTQATGSRERAIYDLDQMEKKAAD